MGFTPDVWRSLKDVTEKTLNYRGADKSLARTGRKQATATENFDFHIFYV
jgi:hypothetical protein